MRDSIKILFLISCFATQLLAQEVTLYRVNVIGNKTTSDKMIKYSAGLRDGTQIQRSDITTAVTRLWDLGLFDDISISLNNESQYGVEITINVVESPVLNNFRFDGITIRENRLKDKFIGQIGMRIMQRPKSDTLFKDEKEKADFMNKMFIENVWCFGPKEDLFKNSRKANLDEFFAWLTK